MRKILTGAQMKACDIHTISVIGVPSAVLMERAACAAADEVSDLPAAGSVVIFCGSGNNGGDGYACARILFLRGKDVRIIEAGNSGHLTEETERQQKICARLGIPMSGPEEAEAFLSRSDAVVDALLGTGLSREVGGRYAEMIRLINGSALPVVSVDIPSGVSSDTGQVMGCAVKARVTVTMQCVKPGLLLYPGRSFAGRVVCAEIGVLTEPADPSALPAGWAGPALAALEEEDLSLLVPPRDPRGHKGTFGKVLLAAGSFGMAGAAFLSAKAALRSGAGMVKILTDARNRVILQELLPEALLSLYESPGEAGELLEKELKWCSVCAAGPGLGTGEAAREIVRRLLSAGRDVPCVLDADAINLLAGCPELLVKTGEDLYITPHILEMSRITGLSPEEILLDPVGTAAAFTGRTGVSCVLKDACTVTSCADGRIFLNTTGNDGMATAGSGDVLTGILASWLAQGAERACAGAAAAYLHGAAGDDARRRIGAAGMTASDIADAAAGVMRRIGR